MTDASSTHDTLEVNGERYRIASLARLGQRFNLARLPYSMKILLENLLRHEDGINITAKEIEAVANWEAKKEPDTEIAFMPARVVLQDFTGVPCVVDLAAMRDAIVKLGGNPEQINPLIPSELVIDHSVQVDEFGKADSLDHNVEIEFDRNKERYGFLRWGQKAFKNFKVVPPTVCEKITRARYSMLTWWTMPVSGGTTWKLLNARCPQRRNAYRSRLRENSSSALSANASARPK